MAVVQRLWQPPSQVASVQCLPTRQAIARVQRRDQNILDDEVAIALETGAGRNDFDWLDDAFAINVQFCRLVFFLRTRTLAGLALRSLVIRLSRFFVHAARLEDRALLLALENGHFVIEVSDPVLERVNFFEQALGEGLKFADLFLVLSRKLVLVDMRQNALLHFDVRDARFFAFFSRANSASSACACSYTALAWSVRSSANATNSAT